MEMTEEAKKKRDELAEKHVNSFNPPIELNGDKQNCRLDFKQGFDAGYHVAMDEANKRIQRLREALIVYATAEYIDVKSRDRDQNGEEILVTDDNGEIARAALKEDEEAQNG